MRKITLDRLTGKLQSFLTDYNKSTNDRLLSFKTSFRALLGEHKMHIAHVARIPSAILTDFFPMNHCWFVAANKNCFKTEISVTTHIVTLHSRNIPYCYSLLKESSLSQMQETLSFY